MKFIYKTLIVGIFAGLMLTGANAQSLSGEWKLSKAVRDGEKIVFSKEIKTTLLFGEENRMSGNAGCNRFSTVYSLIEDKKIDFEPIISTKMACLDEELMKQERCFFDIIGKTEIYEIKEDCLIFSDESKKNVLIFAKK